MFKEVKGPHRAEDVPRNCWTCKYRTIVLSGLTTCKHIKTESHIKLGMKPCEDYDLNPIWTQVDWGYYRS